MNRLIRNFLLADLCRQSFELCAGPVHLYLHIGLAESGNYCNLAKGQSAADNQRQNASHIVKRADLAHAIPITWRRYKSRRFPFSLPTGEDFFLKNAS